MTGNDGLTIAHEAVRRARRAGADAAEAYYEDRHTTRIELREQQVESLTTAATRGLGLRVLVGQRVAYVYSADPAPRELGELARRAVALARVASPDPDAVLPSPPPALPQDDLRIDDPSLAEATLGSKIELLRRVERAARAEDRRVVGTEIARYTDSRGTVALASSLGVSVSYRRSFASAALVAVARQDGAALRGYGSTYGHGLAELDPEDAGRRAARRAAKPLGGRPLPTGRLTVVLVPEVAAELLGQLAQALSAEAVGKGRSMFAGRIGERIGSPLVTLIDQGNLVGGLASAPVDGEGVPTQRTVLLENGVLRGLLHSASTARRWGTTPTGNGQRASYRSAPEPGPSNLQLLAGERSPRALIGEVERGLLVLMTRNVGGINPISGDYSVGAVGVLIERGEETAPVAGVTIAANMREMLAGLVAAADDLHWSAGSAAIGCPTIRIEGMTVAGT